MIDWQSAESHVLLNPRMPEADREALSRMVVPLSAHLWLATSGTTGSLRLCALSKEAMLASAAAVNEHLGAGRDDAWCCVLPTFHVGGLGIYARAFLSGARVVAADWSPSAFAALCDEQRIAFSSLVPAQVSDLVRGSIAAPPSVRAVVVGGGALSEELYRAARGLGWPVLPSYGMTECCSQVATATVESSDLILLSHLQAREEPDGRLAFAGSSLLTGYGTAGGFFDPKVDGWLVADDLGHAEGRVLRVAGRAGEFVKIGGESVDLKRLDALLDAVRGLIDAAIVPIPDERLGHIIYMAVAGEPSDAVVSAFNERALPFERIRGVVRVAEIPRSPLGKLLRTALARSIAR